MKEMKTDRDSSVARARSRLGDERLLTFLRACRDYKDIFACQLVNEEIDEGRSLDEIFYTGSEHGFLLAVDQCEDNTFDITFGFDAGPTAGDGGRWRVQFRGDGQISKMQLDEKWIS